MLKRVAVGAAIAGASWLAYSASGGGGRPGASSRTKPTRAAGGRAGPGRPGDRHPRDHDRSAARAHLAVARADGLRSGRLVQHRPARHAREERRPDRRGLAGPGSGRRRPDPSRRRLQGQAPRAEPSARPLRGPVDDAADDPSRGRGGAGRARRLGQLPRRDSQRVHGVVVLRAGAARSEPHAADRADALLECGRNAGDEGGIVAARVRCLRDDAAPDDRHPGTSRAARDRGRAPAHPRAEPATANGHEPEVPETVLVAVDTG